VIATSFSRSVVRGDFEDLLEIQGILTPDEFEAKKADLLSRINGGLCDPQTRTLEKDSPWHPATRGRGEFPITLPPPGAPTSCSGAGRSSPSCSRPSPSTAWSRQLLHGLLHGCYTRQKAGRNRSASGKSPTELFATTIDPGENSAGKGGARVSGHFARVHPDPPL
jgi:hypothetical protein